MQTRAKARNPSYRTPPISAVRCPVPAPFARPLPKFYWSAGEEHGNLILIIIGGTHHATQITNDSGRAVIWHIASSGSEAHLSFSSGGDL
jgi:hypothetical protein